MSITHEHLAKIDSFSTLAGLFYEELGWPDPVWVQFDGVTTLYEIPKAAGVEFVSIVQQLSPDQQWAIFVVDFGSNTLQRSQLREILEKVAERHRGGTAERTWAHDNIIFVCRSEQTTWTLGHYRGEKASTAKLKTFGWSNPSEARTAIESLRKLRWDHQAHWAEAWDVERLSDNFFDDLYLRFQEIEGLWKSPFSVDDRRTATQLLINRLLFVCFLQKKKWLELNGTRQDYLFRLYEGTDTSDPEANTFSRRLEYLFFSGLNSPNDSPGSRAALEKEIGRVPFLNGGLFERSPLDSQHLPNRAYAKLLGTEGLLRSYNFTIEESTPLDEAVAIDPEMLGKVFEELVNKRHDTGSYYTPRPIVSFMCREAIKGYLGGYEQLVDEHNADGITVAEARQLIQKLERVKFCDPACGSGAYLVGMLQEIFVLQRLLDTASNTDRLDYQRKKVIIENCLYGVDLEQFAVTIAWLRLWLALVIDNPMNPLDDPTADVALPNLDLKLESGDSVATGDPQKALVQTVSKGNIQAGFDFQDVDSVVRNYIERRRAYQVAHGNHKRDLLGLIGNLKATIKKRVSISGFSDRAFLWPIEFPEVFLSEDPNFVAGFDIVLANPPYVRQEKIKETMGDAYKKSLVAAYPNTGSGTADLFIYFYDRGLQLLRPGGMFVYISSNKWFKSEYGEKLRKHIATTTTILSITDFGDLPVFKSAMAYAMIFVARRENLQSEARQIPTLTCVLDLKAPYPNVKSVIESTGFILPEEAIVGDDWTLADKRTLERIRTMRRKGVPLGEYVRGQIFYGIKTGFNEAFIIDGATREKLIDEDPKSSEVIKELIIGRDIRPWRAETNDRWLIVTKTGFDVTRYPAIMSHLSAYESQLRKRQDKGDHWWELRRCAYYDAFDHPKIAYQEIATYQSFAWIPGGVFTNNKVFQIFEPSLWLLGLLQSQSAWDFYQVVSTKMAGGALAMQVPTVQKLPVPQPLDEDKANIEDIVQQILDQKDSNHGSDVSLLKAELDARVDFLYFHQQGEETYDQWKARLAAEATTEVGELRTLAKRGEDDTLEFKSSVIWNVRADRHDLVMRDEVLREISAFLNAEGGTILCGVDDEGQILGLGKDLKHAGNKDKLGLVITGAFGDLLRPNPAELVKMKFIEIDGETILRLDVRPDRTVRYESPSTKKEDAGKNLRKTFVRIHGSAVTLEGQDLINWWERRKVGI